MYRTIETSLWDDPKVIRLPSNGKLLFAYLITNRHSHVSGIYYLPDQFISQETGVPIKVLDTLWHTLSGSGLAWNDSETHVVFVKNMFRYQGRGEKNLRAAANHIRTLHNSKLINKFLEIYPDVKKYGIDRVSDTASEVGIQEQEQEQEQKQERKQKDCTVPSNGNGAEPPAFVELILNDKSTYPVREDAVSHYGELYPGVNIRAELRTMAGWCEGNPAKRKTRRGIEAFVHRWLSKAQDKGPSPAKAKQAQAMNDDDFNFDGEGIEL